MRMLSICCLLLLTSVASAAPKIKTVPLFKHTVLTLNIDQGGGGTRFSFPFVLDAADDNVPFTLTMTNPAFADTYSATKLSDRNSFVVSLPLSRDGSSIGPQRGNLFITFAGYEISVELHSTHDVSSLYSDIVFELSDEARESLLQQSIKQRASVLEREYQDKKKDLDAQADQLALAKIGVLAMDEPHVTRIKEEGQLSTAVGEVVLYVDRAVSYGPYTIVRFEVENKSRTSPIDLFGAKLFAVKKEGNGDHAVPLEGGSVVPQSIGPRDIGQGALTVLTAALPTAMRSIRLQVSVNQGNLQAEW